MNRPVRMTVRRFDAPNWSVFVANTTTKKIRVAAQMLYYKQISVRFKHAQSVVAHTHS